VRALLASSSCLLLASCGGSPVATTGIAHPLPALMVAERRIRDPVEGADPYKYSVQCRYRNVQMLTKIDGLQSYVSTITTAKRVDPSPVTTQWKPTT
jgi:hypothetical protein